MRKHANALALLSAAVLTAIYAVASAAEMPHLRKQGAATQLIVDGEPFLILGGEFGNSTTSSLVYLKPHWTKLKAMHLNTVLAPVSWELIEPVEGRFDFSLVDGLVRDARESGLRLVLLWFGSYKNSMSSYVPGWVKRSQDRFPRARTPDGAGQEILSAFAASNRAADATAFKALMTHIREIDSKQNTVIMIQVENEVGMLPVAREHGTEADRHFVAPVPPELLSHLAANRRQLAPQLRTLWEANGARNEGDWQAVFGNGAAAEEIFIAWHYARYVEAVASAGKSAWSLPMFVNAALNRPGKLPGEYPSGGPLPHLLDIWKAGAPSVDFMSPDIYFPNFRELITGYARPDNPLFVPEANRAGRAESGAEAFFAIGRFDAIGYSPFSIESIPEAGMQRLADAYDVLHQLTPLIAANQGMGRMVGMTPSVAYDGSVSDSPETVTLGEYRFEVSYIDPWVPESEQTTSSHGGLIVQTGPGEYYFAGSGLTIIASPESPGPRIAGIESAWEVRFDRGEWKRGRLLNGDQTHQGRHIRLEPDGFSIQKVSFYRYD
jgi:beta-galactosidase GanA